MRHSSIAGLLAATVGASLGAAMASVDLTGTWRVDGETAVPDFNLVSPFTESWTLIQTGSQLMRTVDGGSTVTGSIDPATGAFSFDLGTVYIVPSHPELGSCGHAFVSGTAAADSRSFTGSETSWFFKATPPLVGCHAIGSGFTGTPACGNGVLDFGEQCDDGNLLDGDCCSSTCQIDPDGTACGAPCRVGASCTAGACMGGTPALAGTTCDDHDACTTVDTCDGAGSCAGASPVACPPCETCEPASGVCLSGPRPGCVAGDKSTLKLAASDTGGTVSWKWRQDPSSLTPADFRAPVTDTSYAFCVFSELLADDERRPAGRPVRWQAVLEADVQRRRLPHEDGQRPEGDLARRQERESHRQGDGVRARPRASREPLRRRVPADRAAPGRGRRGRRLLGRPLPYPRGVSLGPTHHGPPLTPRVAAWNTGRLIASLTRPRRSLGALEQLETIAEGIAALEAAPAGNRDAVLGADTRALEPRADLVEIVDLERDVPLRGTPVGDVLGAEVERGPAVDREPQPAARLEGVRLLHLHQPENPAVEGAHRVLAAPRHADLHMMEAGHRHHRVAGRNRGKLTSGVTSSNVTSTGIPMRIACGSGPTTLDSMRAPSSSSTTTTA